MNTRVSAPFLKFAAAIVAVAVAHGWWLLATKPGPLLEWFYADEVQAQPTLAAAPDFAAILPLVIESVAAVLLTLLALVLVFRRKPADQVKAFVALCLTFVVANTTVVDGWYDALPDAGALNRLGNIAYNFITSLSGVLWIWAFSMFALHSPRTLTSHDIDIAPGKRARSLLVQAWLRRKVRIALFTLMAVSLQAVDLDVIPAAAEVTAEAVFWPCALYALAVSFYLIRVQYRRSSGADRLRTMWFGLGFYLLVISALVAGVAAAMLPTDARSTATTFSLIIALGYISLPICFCIAIFVHGAVESSLAFRRTTIYSAIGFFMVGVFILAESLFGELVQGWFDIPVLDRYSGILAGGTVAVLLNPARNIVERRVNRLMDRLVPADAFANGERVNVSVVYADLVGYSAAAERDTGAAVTTRTLFQRAAATVASRNGGYQGAALSDAAFMCFDSVDAALRASVELSERYREAARALDLEVLGIRTAVHQGEVIRGCNGELLGSVANMATRLETAALPGEVLVSGVAAEQSQDWRDSLMPRPPVLLPGFAEPVACYRFVPAPAHTAVG